ncbi:T-lymphocyte activation antigen CD80-like [Perca fluviatilis]|uniref:T-lymphocyte activation antigen CD80-like n=1 Tax=Perca fluviatilis TaxID=8168 RepID=UPI0019655D5C|nr:T-lymphocyte activation antigen CD80-like [Perca fluviatilis]
MLSREGFCSSSFCTVMSPTSLVILLLSAPIMGQIPLHAPVGGSVLIPCSLPLKSSESLIWFYWQEDHSHNVLFHWDFSGKTQVIADKYRDRCEAFNTEFSSGNISIRLNHVVVGDDKITFYANVGQIEGTKPCAPCCKSTLQVSAPYQDLNLTVDETAKRATCRARGGYPEPRVSWTGQNKSGPAQLQGALTEVLQDPTEKTFSVNSSVSVKDLQSVTCLIYNTHSNQTIRKTEEIGVTGDPQQRQHLCVIATVVAALVALVALWWRSTKYQNSNQNRQQAADADDADDEDVAAADADDEDVAAADADDEDEDVAAADADDEDVADEDVAAADDEDVADEDVADEDLHRQHY